MSDDLFQPTISQAPRPTVPPWRPESILYPAFFGGPMAAAALGFLNGRKLSLRPGALGVIVAAGLAGFVARAFVTSLMDGTSGTRVIGAAAGVLVWLVVMAFQRRPFRIFLYNDGEPASLVGPGIAAAVGFGVLEAIIIYVVVV
jgi:hypothetical protein